jgi:Ni,Fe-hydrogenase III small subunit
VLGRALCIRHIDAGSCDGCELEIHALNNPLYNLEGLGIPFVASPRHADLLLVTGPVSKHMEVAFVPTYEATPDPGCPPNSTRILQGILAALARTPAPDAAAGDKL